MNFMTNKGRGFSALFLFVAACGTLPQSQSVPDPVLRSIWDTKIAQEIARDCERVHFVSAGGSGFQNQMALAGQSPKALEEVTGAQYFAYRAAYLRVLPVDQNAVDAACQIADHEQANKTQVGLMLRPTGE